MDDVTEQLRSECLRRLKESEDQIVKCLGLLSEEQVWRRANEHVVSVGNLVLHLCGNVGQWITSTLGTAPDDRTRDAEFEEQGPLATAELSDRLSRVLISAREVIMKLPPEGFTRKWKVQGFEESGAAILVHVVEHMSYHTGQITLHTKLLLDVDTGYYAAKDLNAKG
ncbi:MAG: DUF1572 family protein [Flavobacteriales bacterium]|nr:DUF1572 family protein [Flavobacteriales bacterium]